MRNEFLGSAKGHWASSSNVSQLTPTTDRERDVVLRRRPRLISVLKAASEGRSNLSLAQFREREINWALRTGLGPLLFRTTKGDPHTDSSESRLLVQSADLTARVLTAQHLEATTEIVDACQGRLQSLTLLKGISICEEYYPEPHLRPMRDLDFLVRESDLALIESQLKKLGYVPRFAESFENHHHRPPFYHPQKGIWVEIHKALFSHRSILSFEKVFSLQNLSSQLRGSEFHGRPVGRLSHELQVVYIASHWAKKLRIVGGLIAFLDLMYLLKNTGETLNWELILDWVKGTASASYLYLTLTCLHRYRLIDLPSEFLEELFQAQQSFGRLNLGLLHKLVDHLLVNGQGVDNEILSWRAPTVWKKLLLPGSPFRNLYQASRVVLSSMITFL